MNPFQKFSEYYTLQKRINTSELSSACCLTSIGLDGYPNARFVSLKEVTAASFVITGSLHSRKGIELLSNNKASLTFWWPETKRQIRVQGDAIPICSEKADHYFAERSKEAQVVSIISNQGFDSNSIVSLQEEFMEQMQNKKNMPLSRPKEWSGFHIHPIRIEFMTFETNRFHIRELYEKDSDTWTKVYLEP